MIKNISKEHRKQLQESNKIYIVDRHGNLLQTKEEIENAINEIELKEKK